MNGRSGTGRLGKRYFYYICQNKDCGLRVSAGEVEDALIEQIGALAQQDGILAKVVEQTNRGIGKQVPDLKQQHRALERQLAEVKAAAAKLLDEWQGQSEAQGRAFINDRLAELGQRRQELESGLKAVETQIAGATDHAVHTEQMRAALQNMQSIYAELQPYERRELVRLVIHKVELHARELVLEIDGGVCTAMGETPLVAGAIGGVVRQAPEWLPERVPQSVLRWVAQARLPSVVEWFQELRAAAGGLGGLGASDWPALTRSGLAQWFGVSRAAVSQALG